MSDDDEYYGVPMGNSDSVEEFIPPLVDIYSKLKKAAHPLNTILYRLPPEMIIQYEEGWYEDDIRMMILVIRMWEWIDVKSKMSCKSNDQLKDWNSYHFIYLTEF